MLGVAMDLAPLQPTSPYPKSSAKMTMKLGLATEAALWGDFCGDCCARANERFNDIQIAAMVRIPFEVLVGIV